jgi:hypothetical protein
VTGRARASTVGGVMEPIRIIDGDEGSLARRVERALAALPGGARVAHFTYWYTGRPPLHEATVMPEVSAPPASAPRSRAEGR